MKELKKIELEKIILIVLSGMMLLANHMSPLCIDDFGYAFSCITDERITNFTELISSVNAYSSNGRILACFVIQLCLIFPKIIFNVINSFVFVLQIIFMRRLCCTDGRKNWKIMLGGIGLIWCFIPAFGEDYLWLCASITYSWGAMVCLLYIWLFARYMHKEEVYSVAKQIGIFLIAFLLGAYSETTTIVAVTVPIIYCIAVKLIYKKEIKLWMILSEIFACIGLLYLVTQPSEHIKIATPSLSKYLTNLEVLIIRYVDAFWVLLILYAVFAILVFFKMKKDKKDYSITKFTDAAIYMLLSLGISGAMIFTTVYPLRVMLLTGLFLFLSFLSFLYEAKDMIHYQKRYWSICGMTAGLIMMCIITYGMYEICDYGIKINRMYTDIQTQIDKGKTEVIISKCPDYNSKYINYNEYDYFNTNPENYVNKYFMRYMEYEGTIRVEEKLH